jgi:hypothetical protein
MAHATLGSANIEVPPEASMLPHTRWANPNYKLPVPSLAFLFHLECEMEDFLHIGNGPHGDRSSVIFKGGRFEGPKLRGEVLPGGGGTLASSERRFEGPKGR